MKISIITLFPNLYKEFLGTSLIKRATEKDLITFNLVNLFDFSEPKKRIDAPAFGHGAGMLIKPEIVETAVDSVTQSYGDSFKIFFSPKGKKLDQHLAKELYKKIIQKKHLMLLPARYEGMDARVENFYADEIISIGDYVLMGGDLPAMVFLESLLRFVPGVVKDESSVEQDSFSGAFVDYPSYTEPVIWKNMEVPEILRSGNHGLVDNYRRNVAIKESVINHFDWVRSSVNNKKDIEDIEKAIPSHYAVLMHDEVLLPGKVVGTSSITSLDIHDIARSSKTYGLKNYYLVSPLEDQKCIAQTLLDFWQQGAGIDYNPSRHEALKSVCIRSSLDEVVADIKNKEGKDPILISTSAQDVALSKTNSCVTISYNDQSKIWSQERPVILIFGTAQGLSESVISRCDYVLTPIRGFSKFNHLSVRSAAGIIFDRWLGLNLNCKL